MQMKVIILNRRTIFLTAVQHSQPQYNIITRDTTFSTVIQHYKL